jgi:hypothetical protein
MTILKISEPEIHPFVAKHGTEKGKMKEHTEGHTVCHYYTTSPNTQQIMPNNEVCKEAIHVE